MRREDDLRRGGEGEGEGEAELDETLGEVDGVADETVERLDSSVDVEEGEAARRFRVAVRFVALLACVRRLRVGGDGDGLRW